MPDERQKGAIRRENVARIKDAAELVFAEQGFRGASVGMIAAEAGVPKPNVYYYFESKEDLYKAVVEDICATWLAVGDGFVENADPRVVIEAYVKAKMDLARARPQASRLWATEMARGAPVIGAYVREKVKPWLREKESVFGAWAKAGKISAVDTKAFFFMVWATTQHYADFEAQVTILNGDKPLSGRRYIQVTQDVQALILASVGLS